MSIPITMGNATGSNKYWGYLGGGATVNDGTTSYQVGAQNGLANTEYKIAHSYVQGGLLNTTFNGNYPINIQIPANLNYTTFYFYDSNGAQYPTMHFRKLTYYPVALTSAQLQTLTSN